MKSTRCVQLHSPTSLQLLTLLCHFLFRVVPAVRYQESLWHLSVALFKSSCLCVCAPHDNRKRDKRQQVFMKLLTVGGGVFVCDAHGTLDGSK